MFIVRPMTFEVASYIAGIVAAIAGIGSLYYAREQHKKHKQSADAKGHIVVAPFQSPIGGTPLAATPTPVAVDFVAEGVLHEFFVAFETTKGMFNKPARDDALNALVQKALASHRTEFAIAVASEMWNKPAKDDVLTVIVLHALRGSEFQLAHQATELFFNMAKKDQAKKLIIDSVGNAEA